VYSVGSRQDRGLLRKRLTNPEHCRRGSINPPVLRVVGQNTHSSGCSGRRRRSRPGFFVNLFICRHSSTVCVFIFFTRNRIVFTGSSAAYQGTIGESPKAYCSSSRSWNHRMRRNNPEIPHHVHQDGRRGRKRWTASRIFITIIIITVGYSLLERLVFLI